MVDQFLKYSVFMATPEACPAEYATNLFFSHVVKHFGLPKDMVSDRDAMFMGRFWVELLGSKLKFSMEKHLHGRPYRDDQRIAGRILEALCDDYTKKLG